MKGIKVPHLIAIAALCWLVLIGIQAKWIMDSRDMIEEQFDQKVSLALCAAVNSLDSAEVQPCLPSPDNNFCKPLEGATIVADGTPIPEAGPVYDIDAFYDAVGESLAFYDINLPYRLSFAPQSTPSCNPESPYCCAINPFEDADTAVMSIAFPGKNAYLMSKLWWMLAMSVFILLFVLAVFVVALRALIHQRRISRWNIDFFNNMAHEFRTPLTNIRLAMQRLVKRNPQLKDDPFVNVVLKEDAKLGEQINRVLDMAALDNGKPYLNTRHIDIQDLLRATVKDMGLAIQSAQATVNMHFVDGEAIVNGDPLHLQQAFRNLLDNALKYTDTAPVIDIRVRRKGEALAVTFDDNGIGISPKDRELIFERFHRIPNGNRHEHKGFGLGLSYVKTIIEDHRGTIRAMKNARAGSQFELILPTA